MVHFDPGCTPAMCVQRQCQAHGLVLLTREEYNEMCSKVHSTLYQNCTEQDPLLPIELLEHIFLQVTDLQDLCAVRATCKAICFWFDTHIGDIWSNLRTQLVPYRRVDPDQYAPYSLRTLQSLYPRIYYAPDIDRFVSKEDAFTFHLLHGNLHLLEKQRAYKMLLAQYMRVQDWPVFFQLFTEKSMLTVFYYVCFLYARRDGKEVRHLRVITSFLEHFQGKKEEIVLLLAIVLHFDITQAMGPLFEQLQKQGLPSASKFRALLARQKQRYAPLNSERIVTAYGNLLGNKEVEEVCWWETGTCAALLFSTILAGAFLLRKT